MEILWSVFSYIRSEYGDLLGKSLYSDQRQENAGKKSIFGHFSYSGWHRHFFTATLKEASNCRLFIWVGTSFHIFWYKMGQCFREPYVTNLKGIE